LILQKGNGIVDWGGIIESGSTLRHVSKKKNRTSSFRFFSFVLSKAQDSYTLHDERAMEIVEEVLGGKLKNRQNDSSFLMKPNKQQNTEISVNVLLIYFADIDARAHQHGTSSVEYTQAVKNKTHFVERSEIFFFNSIFGLFSFNFLTNPNRILSKLDEKTFLTVMADHGHIPSGGHGGQDSFAMQIPLWFYQKGSNLRFRIDHMDGFEDKKDWTWNNLDVTTTLWCVLFFTLFVFFF
jgi:hypothetical protein